MKKAAGGIKFDELRIRKIAPDQLPFFRRHPDFVHTNAFVVDAAYAIEETTTDETENKPNLFKKHVQSVNDLEIEGLEMIGEPMEVSMLDEEEMKKCEEMDCRKYQIGIADESAPTDFSPLSVRAAFDAIQNFENTDQVRRLFLHKMGFTEKLPKNFSVNFFSNAENQPDRTTVLSVRYAENVKHSGVLRHLGDLNEGVRYFVNFKMAAVATKRRLRSVRYHSVYNALCSSQLVFSMSKWPKSRLNDVEIKFPDEEEKPDEQLGDAEFIPGIFAVKTNWTENSLRQTTTDGMINENFTIKYFDKPGGLHDTVVTVKPGWLDNRVKGFDRTLQIKFLLYLCECLQKNEIEWPSKREHPDLLNHFCSYISNLSTVEAAKDSYDFVEGLWDFLICCRSFPSLRTILKETYDAFSRGTLTSKYVHVDNCSTIALILKTMDRSTAVLPRLDVWTCVQIMVEVGVDRLRRDLVNELVNKKRFPQSSFVEYLRIEPRFNVDERVRMILVAHLVLQSVNLINEHVTIQPAEMQKIFSLLFYQFSKSPHESPLNESFTFNTKVCNVESFVFDMNRLREWSTTHEFVDKSGVRSTLTIHLTRFNEFKRLAKIDLGKRYVDPESHEQNQSEDKIYWDRFETYIYSYNQQDRFPAQLNGGAGDRQLCS